MAMGTLINAAKQVRAGTISYALLNTALAAQVDQIGVNQTAIADIIASKGAASGIATLGLDGYVLPSQLRQAGIAEHKGEVTVLADLTTVTDADRGDVVDVVPFKADGTTPDPDNAQSYFLFGDDPTVAADWKPVRSPKDGVTSLRNSAGTVTGLNGVVTLADVAFSGAAADIAFAHADYTATNVDGALVEVMGKAKTNETNITNLTTTVDGKLDAAKVKRGVNMTGSIDGINKVFSVPESFAAGSVQAYFGGQRLREGIDFTVAGNDVTFVASPDFETERPFCDYVAA